MCWRTKKKEERGLTPPWKWKCRGFLPRFRVVKMRKNVSNFLISHFLSLLLRFSCSFVVIYTANTEKLYPFRRGGKCFQKISRYLIKIVLKISLESLIRPPTFFYKIFLKIMLSVFPKLPKTIYNFV